MLRWIIAQVLFILLKLFVFTSAPLWVVLLPTIIFGVLVLLALLGYAVLLSVIIKYGLSSR